MDVTLFAKLPFLVAMGKVGEAIANKIQNGEELSMQDLMVLSICMGNPQQWSK